jgi:lysophospholipase L1-like esterase
MTSTSRILARALGVLSVAVLLAGCPASDVHVKRGGATPGIILVGDSLIYNMRTEGQAGGQGMADFLRDRMGRETFVSSAAGADWRQYGIEGHQDNNAFVFDYAQLFEAEWGAEGVVVIALATNDARLRTSGDISQAGHLQNVRSIVSQTQLHARCIVLVNVRARGVTGMSATAANQINANLATVAAERDYVYVADWNTLAAPHDATWFEPDNVHFTTAGEWAYADLIGDVLTVIDLVPACQM